MPQTSPLDAAAPKPLPSPPALIHYTLESPTLLVVALLAAALLAYFTLNNAGRRAHALRAGGVLALLAVVVFAAAAVIETPRERITAFAKKLVRDTAEADILALDADLADSAQLYMPSSVIPKDRILTLARVNLGKDSVFHIQNFAVLEAQVHIPDNSPAQVQVKVRVTGQGPILSWWRLDVIPVADGWQATGIKYLSSNVPLPGIN